LSCDSRHIEARPIVEDARRGEILAYDSEIILAKISKSYVILRLYMCERKIMMLLSEKVREFIFSKESTMSKELRNFSMGLLPSLYSPAPCPKFKDYNKERIAIWCARNKLTPPKTIKLKKDLVAWCEAKHAEIENAKVEAQLKKSPSVLALAEYQKLYEAEQAQIKAEQEQRDRPKTQAEIEWQQRLDAYLTHTMPKTYGQMKQGKRVWRESNVPLLSLLE
jgi:septum formation topological specificity factor MinE